MIKIDNYYNTLKMFSIYIWVYVALAAGIMEMYFTMMHGVMKFGRSRVCQLQGTMYLGESVH
jgi:hypothetical protein